MTLGCLMVLGAGLDALLRPDATVAPASAPTPVASSTTATGPAPASASPASGTLTQRKGEWSPICARTGQPLVDFSPIDVGTGASRLILTVHNCSDAAVTVRRPQLSVLDLPLELDAPASGRSLRLAPGESAVAVLSWRQDSQFTRGPTPLAVRVAGIGEGELSDLFGSELIRTAQLSGWTR